MRRKKELRSTSLLYRDQAAKWVALQIMPMILLGTQIFIFLLSTKIQIFPNAEDWKSIVGTSAEIIAGLYGITTAGFTFFLSRIDALAAADPTLDYVTDSIKNRFKYLIWYITALVLFTLLVSIVLLYCPIPTGENTGFIYRLFCNEFIFSLCFSIGLILYYSVLVIDPNCLSKEAAKLKKKLAVRNAAPGNTQEFLIAYDAIRTMTIQLIPEAVIRQIPEEKLQQFDVILELLEESRPLLRPLLNDMLLIHRYYACVLHAPTLSVTQDMCQKAGHIRTYLAQYCSKQNLPTVN